MIRALLLDIRSSRPGRYIKELLEPMVRPLGGFELVCLLVHAAAVSLEKRREQEAKWKSEVEHWQQESGAAFEVRVFYDVYGSPTGPCQDWFKNMWLAFQDSRVERIIYLPVDITYMAPPCASPDSRLQGFIDKANDSGVDLLIGTYEAETDVTRAKDRADRDPAKDDVFLLPATKAGGGSRGDIRKNFLEAFTIDVLWSAFPRSMHWFCSERIDADHHPTPRTGFFSLSRRLFEEFVNRPRRPTMLPWAGTVQLLLCAIIQTRHPDVPEKYEVAEHFVTRIKQPPEGWGSYSLAHQLLRIAYVVEDERHYWSRRYPDLPL